MQEKQGFRLRGYANLCREFIEQATPLITEIYQRNEDHESNPVLMQNLHFAFHAASFHAKDMTLDVMLFITPFAFPKALLAAGKDRSAIKFADHMAGRLINPGAYSIQHIKRMIPPGMKSEEGGEYARDKNLHSLAKVIEISLK